MSAVILSFPQRPTRQPGAMPRDALAGHVARFRAIMAHATHRDTGLPMTETELDACVDSTMAAIDRARLELHRER